MRSEKIAIVLMVFSAALGGCSRSEPPESPSAAPAAAAPSAPAPAPVAEVAPAALTPEQLARLVRPHSPILGVKNARVTVVEVLDPACEACRAFSPVVEQLLFLYPEDVRVVVRFADFHPVSLQAIRLLAAAHRQGKFHELLNALYERQQEWASHASPDPARAWKIAEDAGVDVAMARKDALAPSVDDMLHQEADDLVALKVERTPTFFVNGKPLPSFGDKQLLDLVASEVQNR